MNRRACLIVFVGLFVAVMTGVTPAAQFTVVAPPSPSPMETLAAREVVRYMYLRTGTLLPIVTGQAPASADAIVIIRKDQAIPATDDQTKTAIAALQPQQYIVKTIQLSTGKAVLVCGGDDTGTLYGAYRFAETLGVRFYLHGDVIPDGQIPLKLPEVNETGKPLFDIRGIQPFHDFTEGPDWWNTDDYLAYISQLAKMRMNFIGMHTYPEAPNTGPECLVWIGQKSECDAQGRVSWSYPSFWASTKQAWDYAPTKTSDFAGGASLLFPQDDYGNEVQAGLMPRPTTLDQCNELFNRTGDLLRRAFAHARALGVKTCIGTETPLTIPTALREHLKSQGKNPADPAVVRQLYEGMFTRISRACPVDYYWLWTPEGWTWSGNNPAQFANTTRDIQAALDALNAIGKPFTLGTSGWVLGPMHDRAALDEFLPKDSPMACINQTVGHAPVESAFANIIGRPKWAIPWMENDPTLTQPQPWVARMRYDAVDARRYGCTGLLGIHWRTKAMMQNVSALAGAAWDQSWVPADFDTTPLKPASLSTGALGGQAVSFTEAVANTSESPVYQSVRYNLKGYSLAVPDGTYNITLKFNEPHYTEAGKRIFGVKVQGRQVIDTLDIFAKVGRNKALDYTFKGIDVANNTLHIDFVAQTEYPCIAGIVIDGTTKASNQLAGQPLLRKINCGGPKFNDYEADRVAGAPPSGAGKNRGMPDADFYADFARANFGENVAADAGAIMAGVDGVQMPQCTDWITGQGTIATNGAPWDVAKQRYHFVEELAALRPQIQGAGNLDRFDCWLNTYRAAAKIAQTGCLRGALDRAVTAMRNGKNAELKRKHAGEALAIRVEMARVWEDLMSLETAATDTPGEMGTIADLEMQSRRKRHIFDAYDKELAAALGGELPAAATPGSRYAGPARIIMPTVRTQAAPGESVNLKVIVLAPQDGDQEPVPAAGTLFWRSLGSGEFHKVPLTHVARAVYSVALPPIPADATAIEYYIHAVAGTQTLNFPATAPTINQTVVMQLP
jgi:hypothetical protein